MIEGNTRRRRGTLIGILLTAFLASGAIMMIELGAGRLISRHLGSSLYTWTSIIATIMAGLALGNGLGGSIADRRAPLRALVVLFALAAALCVLVLPLNDLLGELAMLASLPWPARIFLHVGLLFVGPAVALGAIGPVVARLALAQGGPSGRTVGLVYAAGVVGSIVGTFLTGYWLVFVLGVGQVFLLAGGTLAGLSVVFALWASRAEDLPPIHVAPSVQTISRHGFPWWTAIATVLLSNFAFMAIEMGAARVVSRYYGTSIYTWTATIGVFLAGITLGNVLGGRSADHADAPRALMKYFLIASAMALVGPLFFYLMHSALSYEDWFVAVGWGMRVVLVLAAGFFLPCVFLGFISPLVVKRGLDAGRAPGRTVADVYAWGSVGGVLGTLAAGYWLIDWMGSLALICAAGLLLALASLAYAEERTRVITGIWAVVAANLLLCAVSAWPPAMRLGQALAIRPPHLENTIYEDESQYSFVAVRALDEGHRVRELVLDKLAHSEIDFDHPAAFKQQYEWVYEGVLEKLYPTPRPLRSVFIGGGGFIYPRHFDTTRPGGHTEVAEIDPAVTKAAFEAFGLSRNTGIEIHNMDARNWVTSLVTAHARDAGTVPPYDVIVGDSFNDFSVPSHLCTREFSESVSTLLRDDGIYLLNMIDLYDPGQFLAAFVNTLRAVFPQVYVFNCGAPANVRDTFVVVCSKIPRDLADIPVRVRDHHPFAGSLIAPAALDALIARNAGRVLTDDYSPTEILLMPVVSMQGMDDKQYCYQQAIEAQIAGKPEEALRLAREALTAHPTWSQAHELIGDLLVALEAPLEASEAYAAALRNTPDPAAILFKQGAALIAGNQPDLGATALEAALEANPAQVESLLRLAELKLGQGKLEEGVALLERAAKLAPETVDPHYNLGVAYAARGDFAAAILQWEAVLKLAPAHADTLYNLLIAYTLTKDYDKAFGVTRRYAAAGLNAPADLMNQLKAAAGREE